MDHDPASVHCVTWLQPQETTPDVCLTPIKPADNPCQVTNAAGMLTRTGSSGYDAKPEIFNTDQGSQFTSTDFTKVLKNAEIAISMDGRGAWRDNVFVERLWRTVKY